MPVGGIPADMLKVTLDIYLSLIVKIINLLFENFQTIRCFPNDLRVTEVKFYFQEKRWSR